MMPLAFDRRPSSDVPMTPVARTENRRVSTALAPGATSRPRLTSKFELFVQVPPTARPSTARPDSETSSPNARGRTDRLIVRITDVVTLRIAIRSDAAIVPAPKLRDPFSRYDVSTRIDVGIAGSTA